MECRILRGLRWLAVGGAVRVARNVGIEEL